MQLSVVICAHNPRQEYLNRVLGALKAQSLPRDDWQLLLIDNSSTEPLRDRFDISWHQQGHHVDEPELGLTRARLCGIREAQGDVIVFVDDDNVLAPDFLEHVVAIGKHWPMLGAWGGSIAGEFEVAPTPWVVPMLRYLAIRECQRPTWSSNIADGTAVPVGAGLVVRSRVARAYADMLANDTRGLMLGRQGQELAACEDLHLAMTSGDLGLGVGVFPELRLTHLIPEKRLTPDYVMKLRAGIIKSGALLHFIRFGEIPIMPGALRSQCRYWLTRLMGSRLDAERYWLEIEARREACSIVARLRSPPMTKGLGESSMVEQELSVRK